MFALKQFDYLIPHHSVEFLGSVIKKRQNGQIAIEFPRKFIENLLKLFAITSKVTAKCVKIPVMEKPNAIQNVMRFLRTAIGKYLLISLFRDDIKYPKKELSRSLPNPQDVDFKFRGSPQARQSDDGVVMDPQVPASDSKVLFLFRLSATQTQIGQTITEPHDQ